MVVGIGKGRPIFSIQISGILRAYCRHIWACNTGQCRSLADTHGYFQNVEIKAFEALFLGAGDENRTRVLSLESCGDWCEAAIRVTVFSEEIEPEIDAIDIRFRIVLAMSRVTPLYYVLGRVNGVRDSTFSLRDP